MDISANLEPSDDKKKAIKLAEKVSKLYPISPIYLLSLNLSYFRLIYLTKSNNFDSPIYIRLEEYTFNNYPEYETVFYI